MEYQLKLYNRPPNFGQCPVYVDHFAEWTMRKIVMEMRTISLVSCVQIDSLLCHPLTNSVCSFLDSARYSVGFSNQTDSWQRCENREADAGHTSWWIIQTRLRTIFRGICIRGRSWRRLCNRPVWVFRSRWDSFLYQLHRGREWI